MDKQLTIHDLVNKQMNKWFASLMVKCMPFKISSHTERLHTFDTLLQIFSLEYLMSLWNGLISMLFDKIS